MEIKMATIHEGWEADNPKKLKHKTLIGGYVNADDLRDKVEAVKDVLYGPERKSMVIVNGDGAGWIDNVEEGICIRQLDFFHIQKYIRRYIKDKEVQKKIRRALRDKKPARVLELITMYINSVDGQDPKAVEGAKILYSYLNRGDEILSWMDRVKLPDPPEGTIYKRGGIQESQNTMISARMKHGKKRWSVKGGCNMARMLCTIKNGLLGKLINTMDYSSPVMTEVLKTEPALKEPRSHAERRLEQIDRTSRADIREIRVAYIGNGPSLRPHRNGYPPFRFAWSRTWRDCRRNVHRPTLARQIHAFEEKPCRSARLLEHAILCRSAIVHAQRLVGRCLDIAQKDLPQRRAMRKSS